MKTNILVIAAFLVLISTQAQTELNINTQKSIIKWTGTSLFQFNDHYGTVAFNKGVIKVKDDKLVGGSFEINMNSIKNTDGDYNPGLVDHLKNADFFDVSKHSKAYLSINKVTHLSPNNFEVEGNLTIKGITNVIVFVAVMQKKDTKWIMTSKFIIDRTRWNIMYAAKGSQVSNSIKDYSISDGIKFEVTVHTQ